MAEVTGFDIEGRRVRLAQRSLPYDTLIVAGGAGEEVLGHAPSFRLQTDGNRGGLCERPHTKAQARSGDVAATFLSRAVVPELRPQAGGFEGLFRIEVVPHPSHLAVLELDHPADGRFGLRSARLATRPEAPDYEDPLAKITDLRILDLNLGEGLVHFAHELPDAFVPPMHRRFPPEHHLDQRAPLHGRVELLRAQNGPLTPKGSLALRVLSSELIGEKPRSSDS